MKASVAIVLIVMGTLLIMTPPISDYLHSKEVANLLAEKMNRITLRGRMSETYRLGCWVAGLLMITVAVVSCSTSKKHSQANTPS